MVKIKLEKSAETSKEPKKLGNKRKDDSKKRLRSLVKLDSLRIVEKSKHAEKSDEFDENSSRSWWKWKHWVIALLALTASVFVSSVTISSCGFLATYENNFNKIVHGDERWCYRLMESSPMVNKLKEQVVGQEDAIALVGASLDLVNREKIIQLAFFGKVGTGKTLISNILMKHFKWQENVISLIFDLNFNAELTGEAAAEVDHNMVSTRLSDCGFNLVVIDDVNLKTAAIERIVHLERRLHRMAKQKLAKIILVVIFKGNLNEAEIPEEFLKDFVIVEFAPFTEASFKLCIEVHEKLHNVKLNPKDFEELKSINFTSFGCKTLAKKLNLMTSK